VYHSTNTVASNDILVGSANGRLYMLVMYLTTTVCTVTTQEAPAIGRWIHAAYVFDGLGHSCKKRQKLTSHAFRLACVAGAIAKYGSTILPHAIVIEGRTEFWIGGSRTDSTTPETSIHARTFMGTED
jgi:hypothetical protein